MRGTLKLIGLLAIATAIAVLASFCSGCSLAQREALKQMKPEQRAEYRDTLEDLSDWYDATYDRDGYPLQEE